MLEGKTHLVTGGAGFIGSHIVEELLARGAARVIVVDNLLRGSQANMAAFLKDPRVTFHKADIRDRALMQRVLAESDTCFHTAALRIHRCAENPREGLEVMVDATFDLVEAATKVRVKKIVFSSSASIYGMAPTFPTSESAPPYDNQTLYGAAKLFGEQLLRSMHAMRGMDYIALRYFNVYGPRMDSEGKYTEVMVRWLDAIRSGTPPKIFGKGDTTMDFVYVTDVARANVLAMESTITDRTFNVGSSRETSLAELLSLMLKVRGAELTPVYAEENAVNPVRRRLASIDAARSALGWTPMVTLEEGLERLAAWHDEVRA